MQSQVNDDWYVIAISDAEDLVALLLHQDDEDLEEMLREFRVPAKPH